MCIFPQGCQGDSSPHLKLRQRAAPEGRATPDVQYAARHPPSSAEPYLAAGRHGKDTGRAPTPSCPPALIGRSSVGIPSYTSSRNILFCPHSRPRSRHAHTESLNIPFAFTAHMNAASVSTSLTSYSRKCRSAIPANTPFTSARSPYTGGGAGIRSSSTSRELRRRLAPGSLRGRLAVVPGPPGPGLAVDVRRRACPCGGRWLLGLSSDEGGPGSSALSGDGSKSGIRSKQARYRCNASTGSVVKSTCDRQFVSARCGRSGWSFGVSEKTMRLTGSAQLLMGRVRGKKRPRGTLDVVPRRRSTECSASPALDIRRSRRISKVRMQHSTCKKHCKDISNLAAGVPA